MRYRRVRIPGAAYFFTQVTANRRPIFADRDNARLLMECIGHVQSSRPFDVEAHVVLPDHLHMIWRLPDDDADYSYRWMSIKSRFTSAMRQGHGANERRVAIWQPRFWEHCIRDDADYFAHATYIHFNPVKHGLAAAPSMWPHSSFAAWVAEGSYPENWGSDVLPEWPGQDFGE